MFTRLILSLTLLLCVVSGRAQAQSFVIDTSVTGNNPISGMWWNSSESGWGVTMVQSTNVIFATLFTYDTGGNATWHVAPNCVVARDGCSGELFSVAGGAAPVLPWNPAALTTTRVGLFNARFADANNGTFSFSINGTNGIKRVSRLTWPAAVAPTPLLMWESAFDLNAGLPRDIQVFRGQGSGLRAVYAALEPGGSVEWAVDSVAPGSRTPQEFAQQSAKRAYVVVNGGYFGASTINQSFSVVVKNGVLAAPGVKQLTRSGVTFFPTRAAFGRMADGESVATWAYPVGTANTLYQYALPSPNDSSKPPKPTPDASFPAGAAAWTPREAIGGGPMLIHNSAKIITATEEVFDAASGISAGSGAPRTAIARLADGKIVLMVVDGRSATSRGVSLSELADILLGLGATDAINLDGGGSSAMVVNGAVVNSPSDGVQRSIPSVVVLRDR
jgi:Phosphodiester glycosidase